MATNTVVPINAAADYAIRITTALQKSVESIIEAGLLLTEAKAKLAHGEFEEMVETGCPFGIRTAQRLMAVAAHPVISKATHGSHLPASWRTLAELSRVEPADLERAIDTGLVRPDMTRDDTRELVYREPMRRKQAALREMHPMPTPAPEEEQASFSPSPGLVLRGIANDLADLIGQIDTISTKIEKAMPMFGVSRLVPNSKITRKQFGTVEFLDTAYIPLTDASDRIGELYDDLAPLCGLPTREEA